MNKGEWYIVEDEIYQVVGDFSNVDTPIDYELQHINANDDTLTLSQLQVEKLKKNGKCERINV